MTECPLVQMKRFFPSPWIPRRAAGLKATNLSCFFPWEINQDGTGEETLNHIGRHELHRYFNQSFNDDPALVEFLGQGYNRNRIANLFQIREHSARPGRYIGIDAPTFFHLGAGSIVALEAPAGANPDSIQVEFLTLAPGEGGPLSQSIAP